MENNTGVLIFDKPPKEQPLLSDLVFWHKLCKMLAKTEGDYSDQLADVVNFIDGRCKSLFVGDAKNKKLKDFYTMMNDVHTLRNEIHTKAERSSVDSEQYKKDVIALESFKDNSILKLDLGLHEKQYSEVKATFEKEQAKHDDSKLKYESLSLEQEKLELEMLACRNEVKFKDMDNKFLALGEKIRRTQIKYGHTLEKTQLQQELLVSASVQYENSWRDRESERGKWVAQVLYQSARKREKQTDTHTIPRFNKFDVYSIVEELGDNLFVPDYYFEEYNRSCVKQLKIKIYKQVYGDDPDIGDGKTFATADDCLTSKMYAYKTFKKMYPWQLSLKRGYAIKQILPVNESGFAYGEYVNRKGEKIRGFYPAMLVARRQLFKYAPKDHVSVYFEGVKKQLAEEKKLLKELQDKADSENPKPAYVNVKTKTNEPKKNSSTTKQNNKTIKVKQVTPTQTPQVTQQNTRKNKLKKAKVKNLKFIKDTDKNTEDFKTVFKSSQEAWVEEKQLAFDALMKGLKM